jgi:anti-sigma B factor antagonist
LTVRVSELNGYAVVTAAGSIDSTTRAVLDEELNRALDMTHLAVVVDLSGVDLCDSTGLNALIQARRKGRARGIIVVTAGVRDRVEYVFSVTMLEEAFYSQPDLETAVRWLEDGTPAVPSPSPASLGALKPADG